MSISKYLILLGGSSLFCWIAWVFVLLNNNPMEAGFRAFVMFYVSLGLALIGSFSVVGFIIRAKIIKNVIPYKHVRIASRQAAIFTVLIIVTLVLQSFRMLTWWNLMIIVFLASFVELFFLSYKRVNA